MTIELTKNDCASICKLAKYARKYLEIKREVVADKDPDDLTEIEALHRLEGIARDFEEKFERIALTAGIVERVASGLPVHN